MSFILGLNSSFQRKIFFEFIIIFFSVTNFGFEFEAFIVDIFSVLFDVAAASSIGKNVSHFDE